MGADLRSIVLNVEHLPGTHKTLDLTSRQRKVESHH